MWLSLDLIWFSILVVPKATIWNTLDGKETILFAHRGEKILVPEHTVPAYEIASILQADYVEPDLQLTKDNVLVCHHDAFLEENTDVEDRPEFDGLKTPMGDQKYRWYIRNFTLAQLQSLRLKQEAVGIRPLDFDLLFRIPTFDEYLRTVHRMTYKLNRTIGESLYDLQFPI